MSAQPKILLVQARNAHDPMKKHEIRCFLQQTGLSMDSFRLFNFPEELHCHKDQLKEIDAVFVGGSGDYSLAEGDFEWHDALLALMTTLVEERIPTFASGFGLQALVKAQGGEVVRSTQHREVGTHRVSLTEDGKEDALFGTLPASFPVQQGHLDCVLTLPESFVPLARSERCPVQAIRVLDAPIVATQFQPELNRDSNYERYMHYIDAYCEEGQTRIEAIVQANRLFSKSPEASTLLRSFLATEVGLRSSEEEA